MPSDEMEQRVSPPKDDELSAIRRIVERIERAVIGDPYNPTKDPGLMRRQDAQEEHLADLESRVIDLEEDVPARGQRMVVFEALIKRVDKLESDAGSTQNRTTVWFWEGVRYLLIAIATATFTKGSH